MAKKLLLYLSYVLFGIILLLTLVYLSLQLNSGRAIWLSMAQQQVRALGMEMELGEFQGSIPTDFKLSKLQLKDAEGVWLRLENFSLNWSPMGLLSGSIKVQSLQAEKLIVTRQPSFPSTGQSDTDDEEETSQSEQSNFIKNIQVAHLSIDSLQLGAELLNVPQTQSNLSLSFVAQGDFNPSENIAKLSFKLPELYWQQHLNNQNNLEIELDYNQLTQSLKLIADGNVEKDFISPFIPQGGIHPGDMQFKLNGDAPLTDWQGQLLLQASELLTLKTELAIKQGMQQEYELALESALHILPEFLTSKGLAKEFANLKLDAKLGYDSNRLTIRQFLLQSFLAEMENQGEIDLVHKRMNIHSNWQIPQLQQFQTLLAKHDNTHDQLSLAGKAIFSMDIDGAFESPDISFELKGEQLKVDELSIAESQINGKVTIGESNASNMPPINAQILGKFSRLQHSAVSHLTAQNIDWQLSASQSSKGLLNLQSFKIDNQYLTSHLQGQLDTTSLQGNFNWDARINDLGLLNKTPDQQLGGRKQLTAKVVIHPQANHIELDLNGELQQLNGLPAAADILLGGNPQWQAKLDFLDKNHLQVKKISLNGQALKVKGEGKLTLDSGHLQATIESDIHNLNQFQNMLASDIQGNLTSTINLSGSLNTPKVGLTLSGSEMLFDQYEIKQLNLAADASDLLNEPQGNLRLELGPKSEKIDLATSFKLVTNHLKLPDLTVQAPQSSLKGDIYYDLDKALAIGEIQGQLRQLQALKFWHRQKDISGDLQFQLNLNGENDQNLQLSANAKRLNYAENQINGLKLASNIQGLNQKRKLNAELDVSSLQQGKNLLGKIALKVNGKPEKLDINLKTDNPEQKLAIDLNAQVSQQAENISVLLKRLQGSVYGQALTLNQSSQLSINNQQLKLTPLQLNMGTAQLALQGIAPLDQKIANDVLDMRLNLNDFSLQTLADLNLPQAELSQLQGLLNAQIRLSGNMAKPVIQSQLKLNKLVLNAPHGKDIPPLDLILDAGLKNHQLQSQVALSGLTQEPVRASATVPIKLSLQPFVVEFNQAAPLNGKLSADMDLSHMVKWLHLDQQDLKGRLNTELQIAGSVEQPMINGEIVLQDGKYENALVGTILNDIQMETQISQNLLTLKTLQSSDGGQGRIKAQGNIRLFGQNTFPYDFSLSLEQARLLRRDDLTILLNGDLATQGDKNKGSLEGKIIVSEGEFFLPSGGGADIPELQVTELNQEETETSDNNKTQSGYPLDMNLSIEVPDKFFVRGRGLESEWKGDFKISGNSAEPNLLGFLKVVRGHFNFLSHRFNFREGKIDFLGAIPPKPRLNFDMAAQGKEVLAIIKVSGSADKPNLKLESEPVLPQDEVLARLLFDKELSDISGFQALQLASAVRTLATGGTSVMDDTRSSLGVDTLDFNGDEASGNSVKAGKYISEDVFVEVESGSASGSSKVRVEMDLTPRISVDSTVDEKSNTGFGVNWNYDY